MVVSSIMEARHHGGAVQHVIALSRSALVIRHWFEIDLDDASMEHGSRIELRELPAQPRRKRVRRSGHHGGPAAVAGRPVRPAGGRAGDLRGPHYHPEFDGSEPCDRVWSAELTADPWRWLHGQVASAGTAGGGSPWPIDAGDAAELAGMATAVAELAQQYAPALLHVRGAVLRADPGRARIGPADDACTRRPELLDRDRTALWR